MKYLNSFFLISLLATAITSCTDSSTTNLQPSSGIASSDASMGLAIYIANPGKDIAEGGSCQIDLAKLSLVGIPLSEADIDFFDKKQGLFKLKVSQFDWLGANKETIETVRKQGRGYYAMALTLNGTPIMGAYTLSGLSSYACPVDQPYFLEDPTYYAPNPGPNPRSDNSYRLTLKKILLVNTPTDQAIPQIDDILLARLKEVNKLKD